MTPTTRASPTSSSPPTSPAACCSTAITAAAKASDARWPTRRWRAPTRPAGYQNYYLREGRRLRRLCWALRHRRLRSRSRRLRPAPSPAPRPTCATVVLSTCAALDARTRPKCRWAKAATRQAEPLRVLARRRAQPGQPAARADRRHPRRQLAAQAARSPRTAPASTGTTSNRQPLPARRRADQTGRCRGRWRGHLPDRLRRRLASPSSPRRGHLWRYTPATDTATDLTPAGGVNGVLGASADGAYVYYQDAAGTAALAQRRHDRGRRRRRSRRATATTRRPPGPPGSAPTAPSCSSSPTPS